MSDSKLESELQCLRMEKFYLSRKMTDKIMSGKSPGLLKKRCLVLSDKISSLVEKLKRPVN